MMLRHSVFLILAGSAQVALADSCGKIEDDARRLGCYDAGRACSEIAADDARLDCYDRMFAPVSAAGPAPAPEASATMAEREAEIAAREAEVAAREAEIAAREAEIAQQEATSEPTKEEEFGKRWKEGDEPMDFIEATIVELKSNPFNVDYMRLDNGQVWREISDSGLRFKVGDKIIITEGILGSFDLQVETSSRYIKVKRLK